MYIESYIADIISENKKILLKNKEITISNRKLKHNLQAIAQEIQKNKLLKISPIKTHFISK